MITFELHSSGSILKYLPLGTSEWNPVNDSLFSSSPKSSRLHLVDRTLLMSADTLAGGRTEWLPTSSIEQTRQLRRSHYALHRCIATQL